MKECFDFFASLFLFKSMKEEQLKKAISEINPELKTYHRSDMIYTPESYEKEIGFVLSGECEILRKKSDGTNVSLNILYPGDSFGILAVLSNEDEFPTSIKARHNAKVYYIKQDDLFHLINRYPTVAMNVISFLTNKITFLNKKIATFSADSVEEKLARYILSEYKESESLEIPFNCKKCSEAINSGRASVYRTLDSFIIRGLIRYENKKIIILDLIGLERTKK